MAIVATYPEVHSGPPAETRYATLHTFVGKPDRVSIIGATGPILAFEEIDCAPACDVLAFSAPFVAFGETPDTDHGAIDWYQDQGLVEIYGPMRWFRVIS